MGERLRDLRCEGRVAPLAVAGPPRLSWQVRGAAPRHTRVEVSGHTGPLWAGTTERAWVQVGAELPADTQLSWQVQVQLDNGEQHVARAAFHMAPDPSVWEASSWIGLWRGHHQSDLERPCPQLRAPLTLPSAARAARLLVTAGGIYQVWVNGTRLPGELVPGFTDYGIRVPYQAHDVAPYLRAGVNVLAAEVADGWWSGYLGFSATRAYYGSEPSLRAVLEVECVDGSRHWLRTDPSWQARFGSVRAADLQRGQVDDLRLLDSGWQTRLDGDGWVSADPQTGPEGALVPERCAPAQVARVVPATGRHEPLAGTWVYDLGANLVGRPRLALDGPAGTVVRLRHGEALDERGGLYVENLRSATQTDHVVLPGHAVVHEPAFTTHGFRYLEITGAPPPLSDVRAVVLSSAPELQGSFRCSSPLVDQLVSNVGRGVQGNLLAIPTDCPQRDERLGWSGDAVAVVGTACLLADVSGVYGAWLEDLYDAQSATGAFPDVAPRAGTTDEGCPGWGDAGAVVPWTLWQHYGDPRVLERAHEPLRSWVRYVHAQDAGLLWRTGRGKDYGDWLAPLPEGDPGLTDKDLVAAAFAARSAQVLAEVAELLGDPRAHADRRHADAVAAAFVGEHLRSVPIWSQTACALALQLGLVAGDEAAAVGRRLVADVEQRGHLTTGFLGVAHLLPALTAAGRVDLAYALLLREEWPSWLYPVTVGATTVWERWDGWTEGAGFANPFMNSLNHAALGSVVEWLLSSVAGLSPALPGWDLATVAPVPGPGLDWARGTVPTPYGLLSCGWTRQGPGLDVEVDVPPGLRAQVRLPVEAGQQVLLDGEAVSDELVLGYGQWQLQVR